MASSPRYSLDMDLLKTANEIGYALACGDCLDVMRTLADNSVDSIVTDPPYELGFMGKAWDRSGVAYRVDVWRECLRVLKPGGHLLAFGGTRTYHRMTVAIEDAGFEIRDMIEWVYGSGFPKSRNIGGGRGTALKPAHEPVCMARKPLTGTVADNVLTWRTGAINVDACRVESVDGDHPLKWEYGRGMGYHGAKDNGPCAALESSGRWPANLIHDGSDEVLAVFPNSDGSGPARTLKRGHRPDGGGWGMDDATGELRDAGTGSAARFFYCAKASMADRDEGLDDADDRILARSCQAQADAARGIVVDAAGGAYNKARIRKNNHPTVKPTDLMRYLVRLVTPPGGLVFDPFMGSGSTGKAATLEGMSFVGIDLEADHVRIAEARIAHAREAHDGRELTLFDVIADTPDTVSV